MTLRIDLTDDEAELLAYVVDRAAQEFSNHGCTDVFVEDVIGASHGYAALVADALRGKMVANRQCSAEDAALDGGRTVMDDWTLLLLLAAKLREGTS